MKRVKLVAGSEGTKREIERQLVDYLGGDALVESASIDAGFRGPIGTDSDAVLLSSELVREELLAMGALDPSLPVVVARRTVNCDNLDLIVALPPGTRALFVNDRPETVRECLEALAELGLGNVDYVPCYPGGPAPDPSIRLAVTPGETALVPPWIEGVIDIGARILDVGSLAELLGRLGLIDRRIGQYSRRYLAKIIQVAQRLARATEEAERLAGHLAGVIDSLRHGILVYDEAGRVSVCNENLRAMLNLRQGDLEGLTLARIVRNRSLLDFLERREGEETEVFRLAEGDLVVRRFAAGQDGHWLATFRDRRDAAAEGARLAREYARRGYVAKYDMEDIIGSSEAIQRAKRIASRLAATDLTILVHGESGTGKELFASAIHAASARRAGPFLAVDLGALSDDLIESELFGYEEGAFTGAKKGGKAGLFELADSGTIFLDEIGNVSPKVQKRLLRVLQEKEIMRVGGSGIRRVDLRVIAASNEDLLERARRGEFREDLYFRLKMGWLRIPPLRERQEDIPALVERFLAAEGSKGIAVERAVLDALVGREWPGNVRELRNAITYMLAVREGKGLGLVDLPEGGYFEAGGGAISPGGECPEPRFGAEPETARREAAGFPLPFSARFGGRSYTATGSLGAFAAAAAAAGFGGAALFAAGLDEGSSLAPEDRCVLMAVAELESASRSAGREAVADLCAARGLSLGPGAVRARFDRLAALGLLAPNRGRTGTVLTEAGHRLIDQSYRNK